MNEILLMARIDINWLKKKKDYGSRTSAIKKKRNKQKRLM